MRKIAEIQSSYNLFFIERDIALREYESIGKISLLSINE
jgi:hypothetical protein